MCRLIAVTVSFFLAFFGPAALAQTDGADHRILIKDVRIFDGTSDALTTSRNVLIEGNLIS